MCVAIAKPADKNLSKETLELCFKQNPDGCGYAYVDQSGEIVIFKSMDFDSFYESYAQATGENPTSPFLVHFRIKTHGTKDIFNCHPFKINDDMVFIHNGIISAVEDCPEKRKSDTQMFNELVLQKLPEGWYDSPGIDILIENYISFSKLVVLHRRDGGEMQIYNERKGTWENGVWFSNMLWKPRQVTPHHSTSDKVHKHLDKCLECNKNIVNNIYADRHNSSFCSWNCESKFKNNIRKWNNKCDQCGSVVTYITETNSYGTFEYCCVACRDKHQASFTKPKYPQLELVKKNDDPDLVVQCGWCGEYNHNTDCIEFAGFYQSKETEFICASCVSDVVDVGLLEETAEIKAAVQRILHPKSCANK